MTKRIFSVAGIGLLIVFTAVACGAHHEEDFGQSAKSGNPPASPPENATVSTLSGYPATVPCMSYVPPHLSSPAEIRIVNFKGQLVDAAGVVLQNLNLGEVALVFNDSSSDSAVSAASCLATLQTALAHGLAHATGVRLIDPSRPTVLVLGAPIHCY